VLCYERCGSKVEDEFTSGIKSLCCGNDISMELSSVDRCRRPITFAYELILLKVGVLYILLIANGLERRLIVC